MSAQGMPPQILALFAPRLPLNYLPPVGGHGKKPVYTGLVDFKDHFSSEPPPPVPHFESPKERKERKKRERLEEHRKKEQELIAAYDPRNSDCATKNPYATLFVGRISYETTEKKLKKEFESFGPIKRVKIITDFNGNSRGYAFIEFESEADLKTAYKQGDGKKIDGRRVLVDVERARTVKGWVPRRLGGGKGPPRFAEPKKKGSASSRNISGPNAPGHPPSVSGGRGWMGRDNFRGRGGFGGGSRRDDNRGGGYGNRSSFGGERFSNRDGNRDGIRNEPNQGSQPDGNNSRFTNNGGPPTGAHRGPPPWEGRNQRWRSRSRERRPKIYRSRSRDDTR